MRECECGKEIRITGSKCDDCWVAGQLLGRHGEPFDLPEFDHRPDLSEERMARLMTVAA